MVGISRFVSDFFCQLQLFRSGLERRLFAVLVLAAIFIATGCGGGSSSTPNNTKDPIAVVRDLEFVKYTNFDKEEESVEQVHDERGRVFNENLELGPLAGTVPGEDSHARLEAFSDETGIPYWVASQAPSGQSLDNPITLGGSSDFLQIQYFQKQDDQASFRVVISQATLEIVDTNPNDPSNKECTWRDIAPDLPLHGCDAVMATGLELEYAIVPLPVVEDADGNEIDLSSNAVIATLQGFHNHWSFDAGRIVGDLVAKSTCGSVDPCVDWNDSNFDFSSDADNDGGSHALAKLKGKITVDIPLAKINKNQLFAVAAHAVSASFNHRQGETFVGSKFRDPGKLIGVSFEGQGVVQVDADPAGPPRKPAQPAPVCNGATDPAAGTIQFAQAKYFTPEIPGAGAFVSIQRTDGSKGDVSVLLASSGGTAEAGKDYDAVSRVIQFHDGDDKEQRIPIKILADKDPEGNETVELTLSDPRGCSQLGTQASSTLNILDDDGIVHLPPTFSIGGTVTGLTGTGLVIRNTQNLEQLQPTNGNYTFPTKLAEQTAYNVIIVTQPSNPAQVCTVANGTGNIANFDVTDINVTCADPNPNLSLDQTFGSNGIVFHSGVFAKSLALQSDGKMVMVSEMTISRFNADGSVDTTFGTNGHVNVVANGGPLDAMEGVAIQSDGKIVVAGHTSVPPSIFDDFFVARFNTDGSKDTNFGNGGMTITDFAGSTDDAFALAIQPDGKILLAGIATHGTITNSDGDFGVARYQTNGQLDGSFGTGGKVTVNLGGPVDTATGIAVQSNGRIVVVGRVASSGGANFDFGMVRLFANGSQAPSLTTNVFDFFGFGDSDDAVDVAIQSDDKIVVAGSGRFQGTNRYLLLRMNSDGSFDQNFGAGGMVSPNFSGHDDFPHALAIQQDGKIVVAGVVDSGKDADYGIAAYEPDGTLFGNVVRVDFFNDFDSASDLAIQPDGKIIAIGSARNGTGGGLGITRLVR